MIFHLVKKPKENGLLRLALCSYTVLVLVTCYRTIDITEDRILKGNFQKGMMLLLKKDVLIMKNGMLWDHKVDIDIVKKGAKKDRYKGILAKGNTLRIDRIELFQHIENGNYIYPIGTILTGEWKGEVVNLYYASRYADVPKNASPHVSIMEVDTDLFEILKEEGEVHNGQ